jgi:hypothetical protein
LEGAVVGGEAAEGFRVLRRQEMSASLLSINANVSLFGLKKGVGFYAGENTNCGARTIIFSIVAGSIASTK